MSLMLAPYNDSMRLGMGFNSYTQQICCDKAVKVSDQQLKDKKETSQVVNYSSKCVNRLSDIVRSMNVSYSTSIKKGTVELAGDNSAINEEKVKESDINAVVTVKVINQSTIIDEKSEFQPIDGLIPGTGNFNETFGDSYISGWIVGGDFNAVISMRALDRSNTENIVAKVKKTIGNGASNNEFNLDVDSFSSGIDSSALASETETTISVSWMGGGEIKPSEAGWDLASVYKAAAAFPSLVAQTPQTTWAILTKYKANRSFQTWVSEKGYNISPLEYDLIASYTADMFDSYMEYKQLSKVIQDIIDSPGNYKSQVQKNNAIPTTVPTLVAVRTAFRTEMTKIVRAVDILARDPAIVRREALQDIQPSDEIVRRIVRDAIGGYLPPPKVFALTTTLPNPSASGTTAPDAGSTNDGAEKSTTSPAPQTSSKEVLQLQSMIAPEIWADLMPLPIVDGSIIAPGTGDTMIPEKLASMFPPPSAGTVKHDPTPPKEPLNILVAVGGIADVTDSIRRLIKTDDNSLTFQASAVTGILDAYSTTTVDIHKYLTLLYQYGSQVPRLVIAKSETASSSNDTTTTYSITPTSTQFPQIPSSPWTAETWSINTIIYGAKSYHDNSGLMDKVRQQIRSNYDGGKGSRSLAVSNTLLNEDPWYGKTKTGILVYQVKEGGSYRAAVGIEGGTPCMLTDRLINDVPDASKPRVELEYDSGLKPRASKIFTRDFRIQGVREKPFLTFPNGTTFCFQTDGNFCAYLNGQCKFAAFNKPFDVKNGEKWLLVWQGDNKICGYTDSGNCFLAMNAGNIVDQSWIEGYLVFSDQAPWLEMGYYDKGEWRRTWAHSQ